MAASATLHCLTGCAIGEIAGLIIGTAAGLSNVPRIALSISLAFVFGYTLSTLPLLGRAWHPAALGVVLAADTLSILTMEIVDNAVMASSPAPWTPASTTPPSGSPCCSPWPRLLRHVPGQPRPAEAEAKAMPSCTSTTTGPTQPSGARRFIPDIGSVALASVIVAFMLGGLLVSRCRRDRDRRGRHPRRRQTGH